MRFIEQFSEHRKQFEYQEKERTRREDGIKILERQGVWDQCIVPGFQKLQQLGIPELLNEINQDMFSKKGELCVFPNTIEDVHKVSMPSNDDGDPYVWEGDASYTLIKYKSPHYRYRSVNGDNIKSKFIQGDWISIKCNGIRVSFDSSLKQDPRLRLNWETNLPMNKIKNELNSVLFDYFTRLGKNKK